MAISYTKEEYELAKTVSCFDYVVARGYEVLRHGQHHKLKAHDSLVLFADGGFKWYSKDIAGNAITLLTELERKPLNEAIKELAEFTGSSVRSPTNSLKTVAGHGNFTPTEKEEIANFIDNKFEEKNKFILPEKNTSNKRIREYLTNTRKLSSEVVDYAITNNLVYQDKNGNCIFVGYDENKETKFATLRGTYDKVFRKDIAGSSKECGFSSINKNSNKLYVFESAIDSLSMMSINKSFDDNYLSLNGTALVSLENILKNNPNIDTIITCLDNDDAGRNATKKIWDTYKETYSMKYYKFIAKDINEQLILDKTEPTIVVLESNSVKLKVGDVLSLNEAKEIINSSSQYHLKADIKQGSYVIGDGIVFSDSQENTKGFENGIVNAINKSVGIINDKKENTNNLSKDEKLELHNEKLKLLQLDKSLKAFNKDEKDIKKNTIREKVKDSEKKVSIANNRTTGKSKTMER